MLWSARHVPFPEVKRVVYKKNPLDQVICQLRFPPVLRIDTEVPAAFQERVRENFPNFSETSELKVEVPLGIMDKIQPEPIEQALKSSSYKNYEFSSEDEQWKISLTRTFVALTTKKYERWEEFREKLQIPLNALVETYTPNYFSRVGLRYIDVIRRSMLNLNDVNWDELLKPYILGILGSPQVRSNVKNFDSMCEIKLSDEESVVKIVAKLVKAISNDEICFMIDSDFYNSNKMDISSAIKKLDYFNNRASRLIHWCISERLHDAMEPQIL